MFNDLLHMFNEYEEKPISFSAALVRVELRAFSLNPFQQSLATTSKAALHSFNIPIPTTSNTVSMTAVIKMQYYKTKT